jgi:hypothetical protein
LNSSELQIAASGIMFPNCPSVLIFLNKELLRIMTVNSAGSAQEVLHTFIWSNSDLKQEQIIKNHMVIIIMGQS